MSKKSPIVYLAASFAAYFVLWLGIPRAHFLVTLIHAIDRAMRGTHQPWAALLAVCGMIVLSIPTVTFMAAQIAVIYQFSKQRLDLKRTLLWLAGSILSLALIVLYMLWRVHIVASIHRLPTILEIGFVVRVSPFDLAKMLMYGSTLLLACSIGCLVSLRIKDKNLLLPVVMFAASIDFWTVTVGPVSSMMEQMPKLVSAISAPIPHAGTGAFVPAVTMGIGDPLFMALVFAAVHRLGMDGRRNFWFTCVIMTIAMLAVMMGSLPYLPALVALAVAVVSANWREFKLTRQEKISTAIVAVLLMASLPLVWAVMRSGRKPQPTRRPAQISPGAVSSPKPSK